MRNLIFMIIVLNLFFISCSNNIENKLDTSAKNGFFKNEDTKTYSANDVEKLYVSTSSGDIDVKKWDDNRIKIKIIKRSYFEAYLKDVDTKIHRGEKFKIETEYNNEFSKSNVNVTYIIHIPENVEVEIKADSGDINVDKVTYIDRITTNSGDINVDIINMKGNVKISTDSGDIKAKIKEDIYKEIDTHTDDGDVDFHGISRHGLGQYEIKLETDSGDIDVKEY